MSTLRVEDRSRRARSSSRSGRERSRSRSNVRTAASEAPEVPRAYPPPAMMTASSTMPGAFHNAIPTPTHDGRGAAHSQYPTPAAVPYPVEEGAFTMGDYTDFPPEERPAYRPSPRMYMPPLPRSASEDEDGLAYGSDSAPAVRGREPLSRNLSSNAAYRYTPNPAIEQRAHSGQYQYAQPPDRVTYNANPIAAARRAGYTTSTSGVEHPSDVRYSATPVSQPHGQLPRTCSNDTYDRAARVVELVPGEDRSDLKSRSSKSRRLSAIDTNTSTTPMAPRSPGLGPRMDKLSVSGNRPGAHDLQRGGLPPPSPVLEAYHGTYQSISPMPFAIRPDDDLDLEDLPPLSEALSTRSTGSARLDRDLAKRDSAGKKRVQMYDPEEDAKKIAVALSHHGSKVDADVICEVLPHLSHDQIMEVRKEYKKQVKVQGKGVNMGKHINMKLSGNFGKAVYVTALGKFESEGYWANFFYQSHGSRRELLIESLMGRTNADIRMIKDEFRDKRYSDSLIRCMEKELKMDKFRTAVLMVLEERRQEEQDIYPAEYVHRDVDMLYRSIKAERGGESTMLDIIIRRSDAHLREVLRTYEKTFEENFARAALRKSNNLVGELIAHILNGVINRPARDALLLQHAIKDILEKNRDDQLRYELLISRLVRMHWDRMHMMRVKKEYWEKYRVTLEDAIEEATRGDFREFVCELCDTKAPK